VAPRQRHVFQPRRLRAPLLGSEGNVPVERTAMRMSAPLGVPVPAGFVARAHKRLAHRLDAAGFDAAMRAALGAEPVVCADETPANLIRNASGDGTTHAGSPHVVTVRAPDQNNPGYVLARRRKARADQIWLFTSNFAVPWTNNASEQAVKGPKRHQAVSGYCARALRSKITLDTPSGRQSTLSPP
jgi:hypothetical protein